MDGKFTIRDILVYFMSGFLFLLVFIITYSDYVYKLLNDHKDYLTLYGIISLPTCYIIGHVVHSIDVSIFSAIGNFLKDLHDDKKNKWTLFLHRLFNGHRIRGILYEYWDKDRDKFVGTVCRCSNHILYNEAKYWSYLNDTFKGYMLIFLIFSISAFFRSNHILGIILLILTILFRERGRFFGIYYVQSISRIDKELNNQLKNSTEQKRILNSI